jgi:petrobactin synthase
VIRVHCFVSCVCESLKRVPNVDQRPYYFGVWDAPFSVTDTFELAYHDPGSRQTFFRDWYERLYGAPIREWYEHDAPKEVNLRRLQGLVEDRPPGRNVLVMIDLFRLPERENKFNQNPFPHYVMLQATASPDEWLMQDPDFRWEGTLPRARILDAVASPAVAGGFWFDEAGIAPAPDSVVRQYFATCLSYPRNPFTQALRDIVGAHLDGSAPGGLAHLGTALRQIPVLAIRKYAYEHGFAFFWRALALDVPEFEHWCDEVDALVKGYTAVHYRAMKLSLGGDPRSAAGVVELLDQQDALETRIKRRLIEAYELWCSDLDQPVRPVRSNPKGTVP